MNNVLLLVSLFFMACSTPKGTEVKPTPLDRPVIQHKGLQFEMPPAFRISFSDAQPNLTTLVNDKDQRIGIFVAPAAPLEDSQSPCETLGALVAQTHSESLQSVASSTTPFGTVSSFF